VTDVMTNLAQKKYDRVAGSYDDLWGRHVEPPNVKLTEDLHLRSGERLLDLACGSGTATLDMVKLVSPGEVVAVDLSESMLNQAQKRLDTAGLQMTPVLSSIQDYLETAKDGEFDVVSMRFALAYLEWAEVLPSLGRLVRPGGRVGVVTNLGTSAPQALAVYRKMMEAMNMDAAEPPVPDTAETVAALLSRGGLDIETIWPYRFRLYFPDGMTTCTWLTESGFVTHPAVSQFDPDLLKELIAIFAQHLDEYADEKGVPLDFDLVGVVGVRK